MCHDLHVSDSERHPIKYIGDGHYPTHDERHSLWVKRLMDPDYYDVDFLRTIWIGEPPVPERPPEWYMENLFQNTGITT